MHELESYIRDNEIWLMERILFYAKQQGYTEYTSTLLEAWRVSIVGLSDAIADALNMLGNDLVQFSPHDQFAVNPLAHFGVKEARLHRERGISLQMFLGLYKYYRYTFADLIRKMEVSEEKKGHYELFVIRVLDLTEIAFCSEWAGTSSDNAILELQKSNREMTNEKNKYLTLFESFSMPAFLVDEHGLIENINYAGVLMVGVDSESGASYYGNEALKEELHIGRRVDELIPWLSSEVEEFLSGKFSSEEFEISPQTEEGSKYFTVRFARMKDVSGKFKGGVVTIEDITPRKLLEMQLSQAQKLESIGQLAAGIAHEINTPIQFIGHNIEFVGEIVAELLSAIKVKQNEEPSDLPAAKIRSSSDNLSDEIEYIEKEIPSAIKESKSGIKRISTIVQALKKFAHPDSALLTHINLNDVIKNVIEITSNEWKYTAEIKMDLRDDLALVAGVRGELNQILLNLIMNAIQAVREKYKDTDKQGKITISSRNAEKFVEISIKDNGDGVPKGIRHRIYDPFFTTKEVGEGTGQGLYIVHTLVGKNHGEINFESEEGSGAEFIIRFPRDTNYSGEGLTED